MLDWSLDHDGDDDPALWIMTAESYVTDDGAIHTTPTGALTRAVDLMFADYEATHTNTKEASDER